MNAEMRFLDEVVLDALDLHSSYELPKLALENTSRRLVVASGNALPTGKILFRGEDAVFADEGEYTSLLDIKRATPITSAVVISASGEKDAPRIVGDLMYDHRLKGVKIYLITCNKVSSAARFLPPEQVIETKSLPEPITYNTSTYLGMILAKTREEPQKIKKHIEEVVKPLVSNQSFNENDAFYFIVPKQFDIVREMVVTKFDELFGGTVKGRSYTLEQTLHARTLVYSPQERFISLGVHNPFFGNQESKIEIPLFEGASFGAMVACGYFVVGQIQRAFPNGFLTWASVYKKVQPKLFERYADDNRTGKIAYFVK